MRQISLAHACMPCEALEIKLIGYLSVNSPGLATLPAAMFRQGLHFGTFSFLYPATLQVLEALAGTIFKMGGDLNLKKSWHPVLMSNQKRVWEAERSALDEKKKVQQLLKEREEERQILELQQLQEEAGGKKRAARVEWMYNGPSSGQAGTTEEMEGYLLGKRRIDGLIKGTENEKLEKSAKEDSFLAVQNANSLRDTAAKIREDPMLAIKKQEQAAYEAMMNDPIKRRMLLKAAGKDDTKSDDRERKRRKHRHHHHHQRDYDERRSRHSSSRHHDEDDRYTRDHRSHRRRSYSPSSSASRSPSPHRRSRRSPERRRSDPPRERRQAQSPNGGNNSYHEVRKMQSWQASRRPPRSCSRSPRRAESSNDDRAARLAEMQQDASKLEEERTQRSVEVDARDREAAARDDLTRAEIAKHGGRASFVNGFHRKAGDMDLGERMGRSRAGMERPTEA